MGCSQKSGVRFVGVYARLLAVVCVLALPVPQLQAGSTILYDFEDGPEGWENESVRPVPVQVCTTQARHGKQSIAFTHSFSKSFNGLQCRVKEGFPMDVSTNGFRGFSAWVFIPKGRANWDMLMFVRCGKDWKWVEGPRKKGLEPGWQQVSISSETISDLTCIQDIGVQVFNYREAIEATICIDQVEMITQEPAPPQ